MTDCFRAFFSETTVHPDAGTTTSLLPDAPATDGVLPNAHADGPADVTK